MKALHAIAEWLGWRHPAAHPNQEYRDFLERLRKERDASIKDDLDRAKGRRPARFKLRAVK